MIRLFISLARRYGGYIALGLNEVWKGLPYISMVLIGPKGIIDVYIDIAKVAHFRSQADYVTNSAGLVAIDFVGRFERLDDDFTKVARHIGLPAEISLPRLQAAPKRDFANYYTPETQTLVGRRCAQDIELFKYQFQSG